MAMAMAKGLGLGQVARLDQQAARGRKPAYLLQES